MLPTDRSGTTQKIDMAMIPQKPDTLNLKSISFFWCSHPPRPAGTLFLLTWSISRYVCIPDQVFSFHLLLCFHLLLLSDMSRGGLFLFLFFSGAIG